jgi:hypothetical protein
MANPLFDQLGGNMPQQAPQQPSDGGFGAMLQQFNQFRQQFQGDPRAEINKLLQSGRITQAQLDQAQQMAQQMMRLMPH